VSRLTMASHYKTAFCPKCNKERLIVKNPERRRTGIGTKYICGWCREPVQLDNPKGAVATRSKLTGAMFQSKEESKREPDLLARAQGGAITDLRMSAWTGEKRTRRYLLVVYGNDAVEELAAAAAAAAKGLRDHGEFAHARKIERLVDDLSLAKHKITTYRPDAEYVRVDTGVLVVEDVKVREDQHFREKRRLMLACHGIDVQVIRGNGRNLYGRMR
jgi:hypothetical protein